MKDVQFLFSMVSIRPETARAKLTSSIVGMLKCGFYKKNTSQKWYKDQCSMSSMPFTIDDPRDRDRSGKATVSSALMDYVNVITSNAIPSVDK